MFIAMCPVQWWWWTEPDQTRGWQCPNLAVCHTCHHHSSCHFTITLPCPTTHGSSAHQLPLNDTTFIIVHGHSEKCYLIWIWTKLWECWSYDIISTLLYIHISELIQFQNSSGTHYLWQTSTEVHNQNSIYVYKYSVHM